MASNARMIIEQHMQKLILRELFAPIEAELAEAERLRAEAELSRQAAAAAARAAHARKRQAFEDRAYVLANAFANPAYGEAGWVERCARQRRRHLLANKQTIVSRHMAFHADREFIDWLCSHYPDVYDRATWEIRALHCAERLAVERQRRPLPRHTEDSIRSGFVHRMSQAGQDYSATLLEIERQVDELRQKLTEETELDEDEIEEKAQALREILYAQQESVLGQSGPSPAGGAEAAYDSIGL